MQPDVKRSFMTRSYDSTSEEYKTQSGSQARGQAGLIGVNKLRNTHIICPYINMLPSNCLFILQNDQKGKPNAKDIHSHREA